MRKLFLLLALILLFPAIGHAAPSISGASGTFSHGNSITITGSNFGTKSPAKPKVWAPFEGGTVAADSSLSSGTISGSYQIDTTNQPHSHSTYSVSNMAKTNGVKTAKDLRMSVGTGNLFVFARRKFPSGLFDNVSNLKMLWAYPASGSYVNMIFDYMNNKMNVTFQGGSFNPGGGQIGPDGQPVNDGSWTIWEVQSKKGTADNYDGVLKWWEDGTLKLDWTPKNVTTAYSTTTYGMLYLQDFWTESVAGKSYLNNEKDYIDDVYIDTTWARVMIGNASTFAACTHREPLIPTAWSGGSSPNYTSSITAYFNQGSFTNGQSAYIFVIDSTGSASAGHAITIAGIGEEAPYASQWSPAKDSTGVANNSTIVFHVQDDVAALVDDGIISVEGTPYTCSSAEVTCSDNNTTDITVTYTNPSPWSYEQVVNVIGSGFKDSSGNTMSADTWSFTIGPDPTPALNVTSSVLSNCVVGSPCAQTPTAEGGTTPYSWDNLTALPAGLSVAADGTSSWGTATETFSGSVTLRVTDAAAATDNQTHTFTVTPATPGGQTTVNVDVAADTYINSGNASANYSDNTYTEVYQWPYGGVANRILDNVPISLPTNVSVQSARLYMYLQGHEGSGGTNPATLSVYRVGAQDISTVTWATFDNTLQTSESSTEVSLTPGWFSWDVTAAVQWAYANASPLYLAVDGGTVGVADTNRQFTSVEGTAGYRPYVSITYMQLTGPYPAPSISAPGKMRISRGQLRFR